MKIGNVFLTHRQLSAQEAAFKMCGLPLRSSGVEVLYLDTKPANMRTRLLLPAKSLEKLGDECSDVFVSNVFDRYSSRPQTPEFEEICLHDFVAQYASTKSDVAEKSRARKRHKLLNGLGYVYKRTRPTVIRTPRFSPQIHGDLYYMSMLIAFWPWRQEEELINGFENAHESFIAKSVSHPSLNNKFASAVEAAVHEIHSLNDNITKDCIAPFVAPNTEHITTEDSNTDKIDASPTDDQQALFNIGNEENYCRD